jgi:type IV pilus assembly protein PilF
MTAGLRFRALWLLSCALLAACAQTSRELPTLSDQTTAQRRAEIRLQLAVGYYQQHKLDVALDEIKLALVADPTNADAYGMRALIYMEMNETRLADENFQRALKLAPNSADISNNYGWFLCQNGRGQEGMPYFEAALKNRTYSSPAKALVNAGQCSEKMNNAAAAERYYLQAFQAAPQEAQASVNLGKLYFARGDLQRARFYVSRVTRADDTPADLLWLAIRIEHKLGDRTAEAALAARLRRLYPQSPAISAYQRGAFDE